MANLKVAANPVVYANAVNAVLVALVASGWTFIPSTAVDTAATVVGTALAGLLTWLARKNVKPLAGLPAPVAPVVAPVTPEPPVPPVV